MKPVCGGPNRKLICALCGRPPGERCARVPPPQGRDCPGCQGDGKWQGIECPICKGRGRVDTNQKGDRK